MFCAKQSPARRALALSLSVPVLLSSAIVARGQSAPAADSAAPFAALHYRFIGPNRGGRVTTVTGVASEPLTFYMGTTGGGVWKTTDAGQSWHPISDGQIPVGSIGAVAVAPSNPSVLYVGTGSDDIRSNVSTGRGVWKSTDAGKTWRFTGLRDAGQIGTIRVHPTNPDVVWLSAVGNAFAPNAERGVFRSRDGGATWQKVLYVADSVGAADVELQPGNPNVVYAAMWRGERKPWTIISGAMVGGLYKSTDGGDHWTKLGGGLPDQLFGKANIAVTDADPRRVYALIEAKPGGGLYRSDDAGEHWALVNSQGALIQRPFYYTTLAADPTNADVVYGGAEEFFKSADGGHTFGRFATPHGDNHDMWISPRDGRVMIQANDGGANVSLNGGATWSTQYNQPTAEIYQIAVDEQVPYRVYGAQQDQGGTVIVPTAPLTVQPNEEGVREAWMVGPGCETGPVVPNPAAPDTVYGSCKGQFSRMSLRTGQEKQYWVGSESLYGNAPRELTYRFQRVSPMELSPHEPGTIYYGSQYVHRTRDEGVTWERISPDLTANDPRYQEASGTPITRDATGEEVYSTLYAIRESPLERGVIWTGANDGPVYVTRDGGKSWSNVTPKGLPPGGRVQNIEPSPHRKGSAYVAIYRYLLGDFAPYVYETNDYGKSWKRLTDGANGIPADWPTRVVREDPVRAGLLYAGTEFGMFVSFDDGAHWRPFQLDLPTTPITDLKVYRGDLVVSTQGRGFWVLDDLAPVEQWGADQAPAAPRMVSPRATMRVRYDLAPRASVADPEYRPAGVVIDYWLPTSGERPVLEVLDSAGGVVRRLEPASQGAYADGAWAVDRLTTRPGSNRAIWSMRSEGAWEGGRGRRNPGPMVPPGRYSLRMTVGATTLTQAIELRPDPRVTADGMTPADYAAQWAHETALRELVSEANRDAARLRSALQRLTTAGAAAGGAAADTLAALRRVEGELITPPIRYSRPGLQAHIAYLYAETLDADQRVGRDARDRYVALRSRMDGVHAELDRWLGAAPASGGGSR